MFAIASGPDEGIVKGPCAPIMEIRRGIINPAKGWGVERRSDLLIIRHRAYVVGEVIRIEGRWVTDSAANGGIVEVDFPALCRG